MCLKAEPVHVVQHLLVVVVLRSQDGSALKLFMPAWQRLVTNTKRISKALDVGDLASEHVSLVEYQAMKQSS